MVVSKSTIDEAKAHAKAVQERQRFEKELKKQTGYKMYVIEKALKRFKDVLESLDCECDSYVGFTCTLHSDLVLATKALEELKNLTGE